MKLFVFLILYSSFCFAISEEDVVSSSLKHYPKILESMKKVESSRGDLRSNEGVFDAKIKGKGDVRTEGFYNGDFYKAQVEKSFPYLNSKIYGGTRQGFGEFPVYEGKMETLDRGENFIGASISLLRDSFIDENRYRVRLAKEDLIQSQLLLEQEKIIAQTMAIKAYWTWLLRGQSLFVYKNLLSLAEKRAGQIKRRIKAGDLAQIYDVENQQYIMKRQAQLKQSELEFQEASLYLSMFYRGTEGEPLIVTQKDLPQFDKAVYSSFSRDEYVKKALQRNLELKIIDSKLKQADATRSLGTNQMLPKVDVNFEWNEDRGQGSATLRGEENRIMLNVEIPIEFNKGLGKKRAGQNKYEQLEIKKAFTVDKVRMNVSNLSQKINNAIEIITATGNQIDLSQRLVRAEVAKFKQGASDLILVNLREEGLAEAQIKNLESQLKYHFYLADLKREALEFIMN